ncbi:MAG: nucleoside phosphorylase [Acholeplasmataceae bacterium]|nr:nucleoside phosphorylase [Acholeplasmataceae bacterium]
MAIEHSYRDSREKIRVSDLRQPYRETFDQIIVTFQGKVLEGLLSRELISEIPDLMFGSSHSKHPIYRVSGHPKMLFYLCPITAPITVGLLEEIVYAMGVKTIVMYGSAGVLDHKITAGSIIVPTKAYRDEGTSYHYMAASDFIDIPNAQRLKEMLNDLGVRCVLGPIWTTDGFYRETEAIIKERQQQGCLAVDMEISAVQAFAHLRGVALYPFLYGADNLDSSTWDKRILGSLSVDHRVAYFMLALRIATQLQVLA